MWINELELELELTTLHQNQMKVDPRSYERNLCNCVKKPEKKFRTSTGFEPVTSRYRCDAPTNWAMKPLTLGAGQLLVHMFPWFEMNVNDVYEIKWRLILAVMKNLKWWKWMMKITGRTITVFSYKNFAVKKTTPEKNFQAKFVSVFHLLGVIG